jgi:hypothetical protein
MTEVGLFVSKDIPSLFDNKFVYDLESFVYDPPFNLPEPLPDMSPFVTLTKGRSFTFDSVVILPNLSEAPRALPDGNYVFARILSTWSGGHDLAEQLRAKWGNAGLELWSENLIVVPTQVSIKTKKVGEQCDSKKRR